MIAQIGDFITAHAVVQLAVWSVLAMLAGNFLRATVPWPAGALRLAGALGLAAGLSLAIAHVLYPPAISGGDAEQPLQQTMNGTETRVALAADGHFWVQARAHGTVQRLLVDTGATLTTLSAEGAEAMGAIPDPDGSQITLTTANGTTRARLGIIPQLHIGNVVVRDLPVAVAPGLAETNVLGMNFLLQLASWRAEGHTFTMVPYHPQTAPKETGGI